MRSLMCAALATGCLLASVGVASAQDTIRLGGPTAQAAIAETGDSELVRYRHGHGGYGRGYHGGYHGRSYYGGHYSRPYYGSYYAHSYYYPRAYAYYAPSYYYTPTYYYTPSYYPSASYYYYPIAGESAPVVTTQGNYLPSIPPASNGTFPYDGGPRVPTPGPDTNPAKGVRPGLPLDGKLVTLPSAAPRVAFPAYGEEAIAPAPRKTK